MSLALPRFVPCRDEWQALREAWAGRRDNPLVKWSRAAALRRRAWTSWWRRLAPQLLLSALGVVPFFFDLPADASEWRQTLVSLIWSAAFCWSLGWLVQVVYSELAALCAALSQRGGGGRLPQCDTFVALSRLTDAQVLVGLCWPVLLRVWLPLALFAGVLIANHAQFMAGFFYPGSGHPGTFSAFLLHIQPDTPHASGLPGTLQAISRLTPAWLQVLFFSPVTLLALVVSGSLGMLNLGLLGLCAGRPLRSALHAAIFPAAAVLLLLVTVGMGSAALGASCSNSTKATLWNWATVLPALCRAWLASAPCAA